MIDQHFIGRVLLETGTISKEEYNTAIRESKKARKSLHEILLSKGKVTVDEIVQAITIHLDITLLKEALGMTNGPDPLRRATGRPLGSYLERISLLFKTGILMGGETNMNSLVGLLLREAPSVMNAERATIFLADFETKQLYSHVGVGLSYGQIRIPWETGIAGWVFTHGESLNIPHPYSDPRFNREVDLETGYRTKNLLCVPLRSPGGPIIGVFQVLNKRAGVFTSTDLEILEILASQATRSIEKALEWDHLTRSTSVAGRQEMGSIEFFHQTDPLDAIVGNSASMQEMRALILKVAPTETTILIQGESGTGKELVARAIHGLSPRSGGPMITLNCAAVPSELIESELFGHKRGSFTGAIGDQMGVFTSAHGGTLFLDEIETTSPAMQVKLLRALQVGEIRPVGETTTHTVDVRLVAATNQDLNRLMSEGRFRDDLFYRVNVFPITIPPLRERPEDIPLLITHFLDKLSEQTGKIVRGIDPVAQELLVRFPWPGNVRELENELERCHLLTSEGRAISVRSLSGRITGAVENLQKQESAPERMTMKRAVETVEKKMVQEALRTCNGNKTAAAKVLGLSRQGLLNKLHKFRIAER